MCLAYQLQIFLCSSTDVIPLKLILLFYFLHHDEIAIQNMLSVVAFVTLKKEKEKVVFCVLHGTLRRV